MSDVEDFRAAQAKEYGTYTATERIVIDGVLAFLPGDPVPAGHVNRQVVSKDQVEKAKTPAAPATDSAAKG